ncbi:MAG TPA: tetratricopeptide repeat protein [Chitinophagales bacterium]|nr:tetratricopeptide repeat protein [Chitinophagales bacterium]
MTAKKGVIILSILAIIGIGGLYFGNFATKKIEKKETHAHSEVEMDMSLEEFEKLQINTLSEQDQITAQQLSENWKKSTDQQKAAAAHDAAHFWESKSSILEAYYHSEAAVLENDLEELISSGDQLISEFRNTENAKIKNNLITFALRSYEAALKLSPNDLTLKLKAGSAYVEGSIEPMKGITLLREVTNEDPNNVSALILLGRFSIMSGQFDKAKERLDQVLAINPNNAEAIFFMAIAQQGLGNNEKAIELFEACKKLVNNPDFDAEIDGYIKDLKSN